MKEKIPSLAKKHKENCATFLRDIVRIQSFSTGEKEVAFRIKAEMEKLGFDKA